MKAPVIQFSEARRRQPADGILDDADVAEMVDAGELVPMCDMGACPIRPERLRELRALASRPRRKRPTPQQAG